MDEEQRKEIETRIAKLTVEHRRLDEEISLLESEPITDQLHLKRLKKSKLKLKDEIAALENMLFPDIIA